MTLSDLSAMTEAAQAAGYDLPPLIWLRAFESSARHSSFTAAAEELHLTQAAVSHQVRSLEKYLGVVLFERLPRKLRLTEIGSAYLPPLRQSFDQLSAATAGLFGPVGKRSLMVRAPVSFVSLWLAPRLPDFAAKYPSIRLRISSAVWTQSQSDETTDVDIRFGDGIWPGYRVEPIASFRAVAVCAPHLMPGQEAGREAGKQASKEASHNAAALIRLPLVHVTGYEDLWQRLAALYGLTLMPYQGLSVDTSMAALELAASGYGPTVVLECFARRYIERGMLVQALERDVGVDNAHYLLTPQGTKRQSPEALIFMNWLRQQS